MSYSHIVFSVLALFLFIACDDDDSIVSSCDQLVVIDRDLYDSTVDSAYTIQEVQVGDDCLAITFSSSGCDGNTWMMQLVDRGDVAESLPPQRFIKFSLDNQEACAAWITQTVSFDISALVVQDTDELLLNLDRWDEQISYSY